MAAERLKELHTALVNTRAAYELALKGTDDEEVGRICKEMISCGIWTTENSISR